MIFNCYRADGLLSSAKRLWHSACNFVPMIEHAMIPQTQNQDAGYKSWQASVGKVSMRHDPEARTAGPMPVFGAMVKDNMLAAHAYAPDSAKTGSSADIAYADGEAKDAYSFGDVVDMINPLHHLPVIGTLYRKFTGDTIKPMSDIIGGALFGGPVGAVASTVNAVVKSTTGRDIAENAFAAAGFDVTPSRARPDITYAAGDNANMANAKLQMASAADAYLAADGRRNFAARGPSPISWNA